jgi:hypothetical protein
VTLRCRQEEAGLVLEIDAAVLERLDAGAREALAALGGELAEGAPLPLRPYRRGSAFVHA